MGAQIKVTVPSAPGLRAGHLYHHPKEGLYLAQYVELDSTLRINDVAPLRIVSLHENSAHAPIIPEPEFVRELVHVGRPLIQVSED